MKQLITLFILSLATSIFSQKIDYNTNNNFIIDGYDVVSYFKNKAPLEGNSKFQTSYDGIKFKFSSNENLNTFKKNPKKYIPQYGGYCAYAIAAKKIKMEVAPTTFEIRDGKLYLFYNAWFSNKLKDWKESDTKKLQEKADKNWEEIKFKTE